MTNHMGGLTDEDLASLPQDYLYGMSEGGRLGYEAVGPQDIVHAAEVLLRNRGGSVYVTRRDQ